VKRNVVRRCIITVATAAACVLPTALAAAPVAAAENTAPHSGLAVRVFASGTSTMTQPDDITRLDGNVYVAWQNGIGPSGQPSATGATASTVVEYRPSGHRLATWKVQGHADGLTADPARKQVIVTVNEDGNSSLFTIDPAAPAADQVRHYQYNLTPLPHGGGTDAISIYQGFILISASAPTVSNGPAVYRATLEPNGVAVLQPVFFDNSTATVANINSPSYRKRIALALTDPDSNEVVPAGSPRFADDFMLDSQGDEEQIYVDGADGPTPHLDVLELSQAVDDTAWVTNPSGILLVTDGVDNEVFAVSGAFDVGTAYVAVTPGDANKPSNHPNYLGELDLRTGEIQSVVTTIQAKGMLFVP
jgi:hypothetical protein